MSKVKSHPARDYEICRSYLLLAGSLPQARKRAQRAGYRFNTSVWIGALGKLLGNTQDQKWRGPCGNTRKGDV